ncbi:carbohydrate ABC transporter permease [Nonomuraea dietziae]|uniref:carbohydrate ABC transporter permease n=1 Tax=Nonomuraea dietziae TaxID=65515 RepID=UPI00361AC30C
MILRRAAKTIVLGVWLLITVFPLYWIVITSLKPKSEIFSMPLRYWPAEVTFEHYAELFSFADFDLYLLNSLLVALVSAAVVTVIGVLGGYVLARFDFPGRGALMLAFLVTQMIPLFIALGPLYLLMSDLGLLNRLAGLMVVYIAMLVPFCTIIMRGFHERVPVALEEAAQVDGASRLQAMVRVILPVMLPGRGHLHLRLRPGVERAVPGNHLHRQRGRQDRAGGDELLHHPVRHRLGVHGGGHRGVGGADAGAVRRDPALHRRGADGRGGEGVRPLTAQIGPFIAT